MSHTPTRPPGGSDEWGHVVTTSQVAASAVQAGRLHDPDRSPATDPRIHPGLLAAMTTFGLDALAATPPLPRTAPAEQLAEFLRLAEEGFEGLYEALPNELPDDHIDVTHTTETIDGPDGNDITLHIYRPAGVDGPLPGVVYTHGGGMTILKTYNKVHRRWCEDLAMTGMVAVLVDYRNAFDPAGNHPFPAGLDDCVAAVEWIHAHRRDLGIHTVVLQGESGGANLALATTLRAKRDGTLGGIDGVYAMVPYISGGYGWAKDRKLRELPSMVENDGYFVDCHLMDLLVVTYDPTGANAENPLCWPYFATAADVAGLPPHLISVNELDPLRDEGMAYCRKLRQAGVRTEGRVNLGLIHAADSIFRQAVPEVYRATVADIKRFAASVTPG
jgi:acetyl esterase